MFSAGAEGRIIVAKPEGTLWVVATPIGNLEDLSPRARRILAEVDRVLCEDTRHTGRLLAACGIAARMSSVHEHNEARQVPRLVEALRQGESMALVSDAGTPLISDPGFRLVHAASAAGIPVYPVPGPCAAVAALSIAGLPTDRFVFEGFVPAKPSGRRSALEAVVGEPRTLVFYESGQRLAAFLRDAADILGGGRPAVVARELTKLHETVYRGDLGDLAERLAGEGDAARGELVVLVGGAAGGIGDEAEILLAKVLPMLLEELPPSRAVRIAAQLTGLPRRRVYDRAMELGEGPAPDG
jgi:16S rRNA (cytidine1402-2'-O)-methyltransferase